jgi:NAD(P) transhydrogenase
MQYDITVIGNDEAALEMLCLAARSGQRTAAVLPEASHSSWLVGLALKRLISDLLVDQSTNRRHLLERTGSPRLLRRLLAGAIAKETTELTHMLERIKVDVHLGQSRFINNHSIAVADGRTCAQSTLNSRHFVIGTGTRHTAMHRPLGLVALHRPETLFEGSSLPQSICTLGGDSFGCGIAALFSLFGVQSRHVARDNQDRAMLELAKAVGVEIAFHPSEFGLTQSTGVLSNSHVDVVDCCRTVGFTEHLNLAAIDVEADENGQLWCSTGLETWCPGVFGIGDVVGFSADSAVHPSVQAERIQQRISRQIPRPHLLDLFINEEQRRTSSARSARAFANN